ncbi:GFA family protein [Kordiimonas sediminis]|uniref:GFA family protein n=1 Tax=Kordiimonas sediminis TaxID=1735581 RepID=UPI001749AEA1
MVREGGCLCGKVRFVIDLENAETSNCHCRDCQKFHGAPCGTYTSVNRNQFTWLQRPKGQFMASPKATRRFCLECGTSLTWEGRDYPERISIATCTLDDMSDIHISYEIFTRSRMNDIPAIESAEQFKEEG